MKQYRVSRRVPIDKNACDVRNWWYGMYNHNKDNFISRLLLVKSDHCYQLKLQAIESWSPMQNKANIARRN